MIVDLKLIALGTILIVIGAYLILHEIKKYRKRKDRTNPMNTGKPFL